MSNTEEIMQLLTAINEKSLPYRFGCSNKEEALLLRKMLYKRVTLLYHGYSPVLFTVDTPNDSEPYTNVWVYKKPEYY